MRARPAPQLWLLALISTLAGLAALEVGLRLFWAKQLRLGAGIEQPHFHHRLLPNAAQFFTSDEFDVTTRTNAYGLRGPDPAIPKPPGTIRVLMLGDSFIFGFPVRDEETMASLVEQGLRAKGYPVEVVNGGVSGYSPILHFISLRDQFLTFEPDVVVLWYDLGDLMEDHAFEKNLVYDDAGRLLRADPRYVYGRFSRAKWLQDHSALAKYFYTKIARSVGKMRTLGLKEYVGAKLRGERSKVAMARLKRRQRAQDLATYDKFLLVREDSTPELLAPYWTLSARNLRWIKRLLDERGIPLLLGVYPYGMLVGGDEWRDGRVFWGFERGRTYSADAFLETIGGFARDEGLPFIDSFERFRREAPSQELFYAEDGHFTPAGQRVLAEHLLDDPRFLATLDRLRSALGGLGGPAVRDLHERAADRQPESEREQRDGRERQNRRQRARSDRQAHDTHQKP